MDKMVNRENFVTISGWMVTDLHLKGNELILFAVIHGFCKREGRFTGSVAYLQGWLSLSYKAVLTILQTLTEKGLLVRHDDTTYPSYSTILTDPVETTEVEEQPVKKVHTPPVETTDKSIEDIDIKEKDTKVSQKKEEPTTRFIPPTVEEVRNYCLSRINTVDPETFVDFYQSKGWMVGKTKMKDWKAAVRTWEKGRKRDAAAPSGRSKVGSAIKMLNEMGINENNSAF